MIVDILGPLAVGFLGSFHCLGMCGPLVLAYSLNLGTGRQASWQGPILHHLAFHVGRIFSYGILGAVAGSIVHGSESIAFVDSLKGIAAVLSGLLMLFLGLALLRVLPFERSISKPARGSKFLGRMLRSRSPLSKYLLGLGVGFIPCMLPWAMLIKAASTSNALAGFSTMALFGLGTVPALFFPGISASMLSIRIRLVGERLSGACVMIMGGFLFSKGIRVLI